MTPDQPLFPPDLIRRNFLRDSVDVNAPTTLHSHLKQQLIDRLYDTKRSFEHVLDISFGAPTLPCKNIIQVSPLSDFPNIPDHTFDAIICNQWLPWEADVPTFLLKLGKLLKPDGLLLASTLGLESFKEFRSAFAATSQNQASHVVPLTDVQALGGVLQQLKFALPVIDRDLITLTYPDFPSLYADIKTHGARNLSPHRAKTLTGKTAWKNMENAYREQFMRPDGTLPLTLEIIYLHGWRPHESQQKALPPGTAKVRLEEILKPITA